MNNSEQVLLVWSIRDGYAYISTVGVSPDKRPNWSGTGFVTIMQAVRAAQKEGVSVTHRAVSDHEDHVGMPLRVDTTTEPA